MPGVLKNQASASLVTQPQPNIKISFKTNRNDIDTMVRPSSVGTSSLDLGSTKQKAASTIEVAGSGKPDLRTKYLNNIITVSPVARNLRNSHKFDPNRASYNQKSQTTKPANSNAYNLKSVAPSLPANNRQQQSDIKHFRPVLKSNSRASN